MNRQIKTMIINGAKSGLPILGLAMSITFDKRFNKSDVELFSDWAIEHEKFYEWLRVRTGGVNNYSNNNFML